MRKLVICALLAFAVALSPVRAQDGPDPELIADLVADLGASEQHLRDEAREALVPLGLHALPALVKALKGRNVAGRVGAARTLGDMGKVAIDAVPELLVAKESENAELRVVATRALARVDPERFAPKPKEPVPEADPLANASLEDLVKALADDDKAKRLSAIQHLTRAEAEPLRIVDALTTLLDDRDTDVIHDALRGIEWHGTKSSHAAADVLSVLHKPTFRLRAAGYDALARMRGGAVAASLTELSRLHELRRDDDGARPWVLGVLWEIGPEAVAPLAIEALAAETAPMRAAGADALAAIRADDPLVRSSLVLALGDRSAVVRRQAAEALGALGSSAAKDAIQPLVALMNDDKSRAQPDAARALGQIIVDVVRRPARPSRMPADARKSIDAGLDWLVRHQDEDGRWDCDDFFAHDPDGDRCSGPGQSHNDTGLTGLCVLALLHADASGRLADGEEDARSRAVRRGLRYLLKLQDQDGCFGPRGPENKHWIYGHGISILAFCEAWSRTRNPLYRGPIQKALDFTAQARNPESAWRYGFRPGDSDTSVTGWMVAALKTGQRAGLHVDRTCFDGALAYLDSVTNKETGAVQYWTQSPTTAARMGEVGQSHPEKMSDAMTASGLLQRIHMGHTPDTHPVLAKSVERLGLLRPEWSKERGVIDLYFWYPATVALRELGGEAWRKWKKALKNALVGAQNGPKTGCREGSWAPDDAWKIAGGRVYTTAMAVLCLEVHNDYALPIFRASGSEGRVLKALRALKRTRDDSAAREAVREAAADALATYDSF